MKMFHCEQRCFIANEDASLYTNKFNRKISKNASLCTRGPSFDFWSKGASM
jgi:hypothetical protein